MGLTSPDKDLQKVPNKIVWFMNIVFQEREHEVSEALSMAILHGIIKQICQPVYLHNRPIQATVTFGVSSCTKPETWARFFLTHRSIFHESSKNGASPLCRTSLVPPFTKNTQCIAADRKTVAKMLVLRGRRISLHVPVVAFHVSAAGMWQDCNKRVSKRLFYLKTDFLAPKSPQWETEFQRR
jgi:hypothetical protein